MEGEIWKPRQAGDIEGTVTRLRVFLILAGVMLFAVGGGLAGTIAGTAGNDTLRGSRKADVLAGRAGNDRLYGFAGTDVLSGGPGADQLDGGADRDILTCGPGRDVAVADVGDLVAKDCEVVRGLPEKAPPPPSPPPASPPAPPPSPSPAPLSGRYSGTTSQGKPIVLEVSADGATLTRLDLEYDAKCPPSGNYAGAESTAAALPIQSDRTFTAPLAKTPVSANTGSVNGTFDTAGKATGTLTVHVTMDVLGKHIECESGTISWTASRS